MDEHLSYLLPVIHGSVLICSFQSRRESVTNALAYSSAKRETRRTAKLSNHRNSFSSDVMNAALKCPQRRWQFRGNPGDESHSQLYR